MHKRNGSILAIIFVSGLALVLVFFRPAWAASNYGDCSYGSGTYQNCPGTTSPIINPSPAPSSHTPEVLTPPTTPALTPTARFLLNWKLIIFGLICLLLALYLFWWLVAGRRRRRQQPSQPVGSQL